MRSRSTWSTNFVWTMVHCPLSTGTRTVVLVYLPVHCRTGPLVHCPLSTGTRTVVLVYLPVHCLTGHWSTGPLVHCPLTTARWYSYCSTDVPTCPLLHWSTGGPLSTGTRAVEQVYLPVHCRTGPLVHCPLSAFEENKQQNSFV